MSDNTVSFLDLESMALGKQLSKARIKPCEAGRKKYIEAVDVEGRLLRTPCSDEREVSKSFTIIANYLRWSQAVVSDEAPTGRELW